MPSGGGVAVLDPVPAPAPAVVATTSTSGAAPTTRPNPAPGSARGPLGGLSDLVDNIRSSQAGPYILPVLVALLWVVGAVTTVGRIQDLTSWHGRYDGTGEHLVLGCEAADRFGSDLWICDGALVADGSVADVRSELVASKGAWASRRPYVGEQVEVFFEPDVLGRVHPRSNQLNEVARLYLSLLPRLLLLGGATIWLAGWVATRELEEHDLLAQDQVAFPGRFAWRRRGSRWLALAVALVIANHLLTSWVIGSLNTF